MLLLSRRTKRSAAMLVVGFAAAACGGTIPASQGGLAGLDVITKTSIDSSYQPGNVAALTAGKAPVEIYAPPGGDPEAVAAALKLPGFFSPRKFVALDPSPTNHDRSRFVLVFGAPENFGGPSACSGNAPANPNVGVVLAAFCHDKHAVTEARLSSAHLGDPANPAFTKSIRRLFAIMLPPRNPNDRGDRRKSR